MPYFKSGILWAGLLLFVVPPASGQTPDKDRPKAKPAATAEAAVARLAAAHKAASVEQVLEILAADQRKATEYMIRAVGEAEKAEAPYQEALLKAFGKSEDDERSLLKLLADTDRRIMSDRYVGISVLERLAGEGKSVTLRCETSEHGPYKGGGGGVSSVTSFEALKEGDGWKLVVRTLPTSMIEAEAIAAVWEKRKKIVETVTAEVKRGKYPTRSDAERAVADAFKR